MVVVREGAKRNTVASHCLCWTKRWPAFVFYVERVVDGTFRDQALSAGDYLFEDQLHKVLLREEITKSEKLQ